MNIVKISEMTGNEAYNILASHISSEKMKMHCLATAKFMYDLAIRLNQNTEYWSLAGMLHDIDIETTNGNPFTHGPAAADLLKTYQIPEEVIEAITLHNEMAGVPPRSAILHHALAAAETLTGMIFATALVYPDKKISSVKAKSVIKRMKEKNFAASVKRENILECEKIGISLDEFVNIGLTSLSEIENKLNIAG